MTPDDREDRQEAPTYQGSRFPWWLTLLYAGFMVFGFLYLAFHYLPDLRDWLER